MKLFTKILCLSIPLIYTGFNLCSAQTANFDAGGSPIEIYAEEGIEWHQEKLVFVARGKAQATRNGLKVKANELRAYYKKLLDGSTEIIRLDAISNVSFVSDQYTAFGEHAIYDINSKIITMTGNNLKLIADKDWLAANDQLEYWEKKQMAVARGKAVAVRENKKIFADILAAYFKKDRANNSKIYRVDAFDNVKILTEKDKAISDRGVYNVESGIASLSGSVQITRGKNILRGCSAEVNLNTGISKLFRCPKGNNRVSGSISSKKK